MSDLISVVVSGVDVTDQGQRANRDCPECSADVYKFPWWDHPWEAGGACIGSFLLCDNPDCDWEEYH